MASAVAWQFSRLAAEGPASRPGAKAYRIEITSKTEIAQTFNAPWNNFSRVRLRFAVDGQPSGTLNVAIDRVAPKTGAVLNRELRSVQIGSRRLRNDQDVDLIFPAIPDSGGQRYRLRVSAPDVRSGTLALWANHDDTYESGALYIDGREQWGDLVFSAWSTASTTAQVIKMAMSGRPWPFSSPATFWILLVIFCLTVARLVVLAAEVTGVVQR